jgi:hypothetical protein
MLFATPRSFLHRVLRGLRIVKHRQREAEAWLDERAQHVAEVPLRMHGRLPLDVDHLLHFSTDHCHPKPVLLRATKRGAHDSDQAGNVPSPNPSKENKTCAAS